MAKRRTVTNATPFAETTAWQYAVKFLCGSADESDGKAQQVAKGVYFTLINVHNPSELKVRFNWKAVVETKAGIVLNSPRVSAFRTVSVNGNSAAKIDAPDLFAAAGARVSVIVGGSQFMMGYVVIISPAELDVNAMYTARPQTGQVASIAVAAIQPRILSGSRESRIGLLRDRQA